MLNLRIIANNGKNVNFVDNVGMLDPIARIFYDDEETWTDFLNGLNRFEITCDRKLSYFLDRLNSSIQNNDDYERKMKKNDVKYQLTTFYFRVWQNFGKFLLSNNFEWNGLVDDTLSLVWNELNLTPIKLRWLPLYNTEFKIINIFAEINQLADVVLLYLVMKHQFS